MQANSNIELEKDTDGQIIDIDESNPSGDDLKDDPVTKITRQR